MRYSDIPLHCTENYNYNDNDNSDDNDNDKDSSFTTSHRTALPAIGTGRRTARMF